MTYEQVRYGLCLTFGYTPAEVDDMDPDHIQSLCAEGKAFPTSGEGGKTRVRTSAELETLLISIQERRALRRGGLI